MLIERFTGGVRRLLRRVEAVLAAVSLLTMLALTLGQIIARNFFDTGLPAADTLARYLVLYVAFFGAALASDTDQHIKIDVLCAFLKPDRLKQLYRPLHATGALITLLLTQAAARLWWEEWSYAAPFEHWTVVLMSIVPVGFGLLCLHFTLDALAGPENGSPVV